MSIFLYLNKVNIYSSGRCIQGNLQNLQKWEYLPFSLHLDDTENKVSLFT